MRFSLLQGLKKVSLALGICSPFLARYTKALQAIKKLAESQSTELKLDREKLLSLKKDKDRATSVCCNPLRLFLSNCLKQIKIEREIQLTHTKISTTNNEATEIKENKVRLERDMNQVTATLSIVEEDKAKLERIQHECNVLRKSMRELRDGSLPDYAGIHYQSL
jgi:DNA repair exonuclease SbcCD ATPase subunit